MLEDKNTAVHNVVIEQLKQINMTGVKEVKTFDEESVVLDTVKGTLTVKGENLNITSFSANSGDLLMQGDIWGLVYSSGQKSGGFLRRVFK